MSSRELPARPHLAHVKNEAKALFKDIKDGNAEALRRARDVLGVRPVLKLTDAQRVVAREYGFPTWARLRSHVQASRGSDEAIDAFLAAVDAQDAAAAMRVIRQHPSLPPESLHVAAVLGREDDARKLIAEDRTRVSARAGQSPAEPLLFLCFSPFHGESSARDAGLLATARLLLDAGANPNCRDNRHGVPALFAVTGLRSVLPIARLLLDAGANPTDGESLFHAAEHFHEDALELLLSAGADVNYTGDWGNTAIYFLLRWWNVEREPRVASGFKWLLDHGADPNVRCTEERETSLHVAARRGQAPSVVQLLLDRGADVNALRGDGSSAWLLASRNGFDEVASLLEAAGADTRELSPLELLLAACGRGDVAAASDLTSPELIRTLDPADRRLLPEAADANRTMVVAAFLAARFPIDATDALGATALHYAAIRGRIDMLRSLLAAGAVTTIRDREHSSTPLGWAFYGADFIADAAGDYPGCVRALLDAGARPMENEHEARDAGVQAVLLEYRLKDRGD